PTLFFPRHLACQMRNSPRRSKRLHLELLERRRCLAAEFGFVISSAAAGSSDMFDALKIDSAGNLYVSSNAQLLKYSPARSILWSVNLPRAYELDFDPDGNIFASGGFGSTLTLPGIAG